MRSIAATLKTYSGSVAEWFKALVLKTSEPKGSVGSNPTSSANSFNRLASLISVRKTLLQVRYKLANLPVSFCSRGAACSTFVAAQAAP